MTTTLARQVPEDLATGMTWTWSDGRLEFRFPHVRDEQATLVRLADWLAEDEENAAILAEWMQRVESAYAADPLMQISEERR
jgi:hypothetical protein